MKILFLVARFYPEIGGVEKHVLEISKELVKRKNEVFVLTEFRGNSQHNKKNIYQSRAKSDTYSYKSKQPVKSIQTDNYNFQGIEILRTNFGESNWFKKFRIWFWIVKNINLFKDADIVHCHDVFFWYLPLRFLLPQKKVFITFHGYETKFPPTIKAKLIRKVSEALTSGNICVGSFIEKWYGTKANFITYGAVEKKSKTSNLKTSTNKILNILFVGRIEKDTGVEVYLKALDGLKKLGIKYAFIACGDGSLAKKVRKYGKAMGFVQDLSSYIKKADIIFSSSYLSMLEAIALKKRVFAAYDNELKKDYLEMSPFQDHVGIYGSSQALLSGLTEPARAENVKKGAEWASRQTWDKVTDMYLKLWKI